jgi:REP element-mobilizing transposase RayT
MRDRLFVHIVWTTRGREPTIDATVARFLSRFLPAIARQERAGLHALGMVRTHVHLLLQLHPTTNISRLLQRLKGGSSVLANREGHAAARPLRWARGYNIEISEPTRTRGRAGVRVAAAGTPSAGSDTRVERGG